MPVTWSSRRGRGVGAVHIGALAAAGVARGQCVRAAPGRGRRDGQRAPQPGRIPRARPDLRVQPQDDRGRAGRLGRRDRACCRSSRTTRPRIEPHSRMRWTPTSSSRQAVSPSGPHDLVRRVTADLGVREVFWGVAVKPGKPLAFGVRGDDARVRTSGKPRVVARRRARVRSAGAARAPRARRSRRRRTRRGVWRRRSAATRSVTSSSVRAGRSRRTAAMLEPVTRPGVAHDRPRRDGRRARSRSSR